MAVSSRMFGNFLKCALNKEVTLTTGTTTLKAMLLTNAQATALTDGTAQDSWIYKSSITSEVSGTGYTAGGASLSSVTVNYVSGTNTIVVDAADLVWSASTITARFCVIYDSAPATDATRPLISMIDFGADMSSSNGNFTITFDAQGIFTISTT